MGPFFFTQPIEFHTQPNSAHYVIYIDPSSQRKNMCYQRLHFVAIHIIKLEAGHSIECVTHAGHSITFLHFFDRMTLTFDILT